MAKNERLAPSESSPRRSGGSKGSAFSWTNLRTVLIGGALVLVGVVGGRAIDHRFDANHPDRIGFGAMAAMMDDDDARGAVGPQMGGAMMGGDFGGRARDRVVGTVVALNGDQLTINTVNGNVTLALDAATAYTATTTATVADLTTGATIEVHLDRANPMQAKEINISK